METEKLKVLCDTVVKLTRIKIKVTEHLCVGNFSGECLYQLVKSYECAKGHNIDSIIESIEASHGQGKAMQVADILRED